MPNIEYNTWYNGISSDDYISGKGQYIEGSNVDGIREGYGITLGPKSINQLYTNEATRGFVDRSGIVDGLLSVGDKGTIYDLGGTDNTPLYTLTNTTFDIFGGFRLGSFYYFTMKYGINNPQSQVKIGRISLTDINLGNWSALDESWESGLSTDTTSPIITLGNNYIIGTNNGILKITDAGVKSLISFGNGYFTGLTSHGSTIKCYTIEGVIYYWDGVSSGFNASQVLGERIQKVSQIGSIDFITTELGNFYISSGYDYQLISKGRKSNRLNDNSSYFDILNFSNDRGDNIVSTSINGDTYIISGNKIYKYGELIKGLSKGFHCVLDTNSEGLKIDEIFTIFGHKRSSKLLYSYRIGTTYGIDYIDLKSLQTAKNGYIITNIFRGPPNKINKLKEIRITTSNTDGLNNYIKLYKRINNGNWDLVRTINNSTSEIKRDRITGFNNKQFIDIQFKIEFNNDTQDNTPPVLHNLELIYDIIKE